MSNSPQPPQTSSTIQRASEGTVDGLLAATFRGNGNATVDETAARPQAPTSPPANTGSEHRAPPIAAAEPVAAGDGNKNGRSNLAQPSPGSGLVTNALAALRGAANHAGGERTENGLSDEQMALLRSKASSSTVLEDVSEELSAAVGLAQRIRTRRVQIDGAAARFGFIFDCLFADPPKLILARDERIRTQVELYQRSGILARTLARISAGSSVGLVLAALGASLALWIILFAGIYWVLNKHTLFDGLFQNVFFMPGKALVVISSAAFIGGVISIATRVKEFSRVRDLDPFAMFRTAMLKPLIGVVLAVFILTALVGGFVQFSFLSKDLANLVNSDLTAQTQVTPTFYHILWTIGFLAGFSERFAWDFVDRAQGIVNGGFGAKQKT